MTVRRRETVRFAVVAAAVDTVELTAGQDRRVPELLDALNEELTAATSVRQGS